MNNSPTHDAISQRAYQLWQNAGQPEGRHDEFWLQAEGELRKSTTREPAGEHHAAHSPDADAALKEAQKKDARAPQMPHTSAPKNKPAPSGKPLYDKPHSS